MEAKDASIKATAETLKRLRNLKLRSWETAYSNKLLQLRDVERSWLKGYLYLFWASPTLVSVIAFGVCILVGTPPTAGAVLPALATFRIIQEPIYNLPELVAMITQTKTVSIMAALISCVAGMFDEAVVLMCRTEHRAEKDCLMISCPKTEILPKFSGNERWKGWQTDKEKAIDDWLPITSSRNAKWWYSAFHNVTAMVGAGVLSLPYAMSHLGWGPGIVVLVLSWIITLYTLWQMVEMHEMVPGKRFDRYHELGQYAFGDKLGLWIVVPQQLVVEVGVNIVYMVTGGKSLKKFHDVVCPDCKSIKLTYFIMIFASVHFVLSQLPNFNSISGVSLAAAVMSLSYSTIAWATPLHKGKQEHVDYSNPASTTAGTVFNFFNALGDVAFAYAGHNVVLEIQATIPSTPENPSKKPMWKGVVVAYIVVAICYFPVALIGYWAFGNAVDDNILITLEKPRWLIALANMFVVVHVIGSYQIYAMPVFDMIETVLVKKLHFPPGLTLRLIARSVYVALTMFIGITFPFFGGLLGFFGGFAFAPTTYFLPCIMWLAIYKPRRFSASWMINWICIVLGVLLMLLSPIGGLRSIILQASSYRFFS
ncbi:hypothetical protein OPV22_029970 [Ensete ventricosum]|uniref:Amino acid transporter transmembrane domain-containing protein n=1 Tax=Ensete ventricosum TaxID=4639 RepID=A0AAV8QCR5_ENSVE|nr:hypothetical protein OPV22_029970 [Ensete ventricosum]